jgi:pilus assembly protein CpaC
VNIGGGVFVPGLRVRRADTTVELRNSQSFAIAGLLENNISNNKAQVPWLGDVPVLGSLFRSSSYQKSETELVIIVTPRLVQPARDLRDLATPLDNSAVPNEREFFLNGQMDGPSSASSTRGGQPRPARSDGFNSAGKTAPNTATRKAQAGGLSADYGYALQ